MSHILRECASGMLTARMSTRAVAREFNVNFFTISCLQRRFREFGITSNSTYSQPQTNHTSPGPPHPASSPPRSSETDTRTAAATISLHNQRISAQTVRNRLREAHLLLVVLIGVLTWLQFIIVIDLCGQMLTFDGVWYFGEVFSSQMNPGFHCTGQMADSVYGVVWVSGLLMSTLWIEWRWGYGMGRHMLWTTNTGVIYWWHFECTEIPWRDPEAHCCAIHPWPSPHVAAW